MAFRFRRRIRVAPGVSINLGKRGASLSVGPRGMTTNLGERGTRTTVGVPGTGISYTSRSSAAGSWIAVVLVIAFVLFLLS